MFIKASDLNGAIDYISSVASLDKNNPGILFDIKDGEVTLFYSSGERAIQHTIPAGVDADEYHGKAIFEYQRLVDTLATSRTSGSIKVDDIEFKLSTNPDGSGKAVITIVKMVELAGESGDSEPRIVSVNTHDLGWWNPENVTMRAKVLLNPICEDLFDENNAEVWDASEFLTMLSDVNYGDSKIAYVNAAIHGAFESNTASLVHVKSQTEHQQNLSLNTNIIPALSTIFKQTETGNIVVNILYDDNNKPFAYIMFTEDHKTSVYMKAGAIVKLHGSRMSTYKQMKYTDYQASILTEVIKDGLKSAVSINASAKGVIKFVRTEDGTVDMVVSAENSGASINNTYNLRCTSFNSTREDDENSDSIFEFSVTLKNLYDEINHNRFGYTALDFEVGPDGRKYLRIGFFDLEDAHEYKTKFMETKAKEAQESGSDEPAVYTKGDKMEARNFYMRTFVYIMTE